METVNAGSAKTRTKIVYLIDRLQMLGGAESILLRLTTELPRRGIDCSVVCLDPAPVVHTRFECPVHLIPLRRVASLHGARCAFALFSLLRRIRPHIVQCFFETSDLWGGPLAKLAGVRHLISSHRDMGYRLSPRHRRAYRRLHRIFSQVHAVSDDVRAMCIEDLGFAPAQVHCTYNGLDLAAFDQQAATPRQRGEWDIDPTAPLVLTVGNLRAVKGADIFIEAAAQVRRTFSQAVFVLVGDRSEQEHCAYLDRRIDELGLHGAVRMLGARSDVAKLLPLATLYCQLSRSEGFSNALLEAMAARRPCVASNVGGNRVLIQDGATGALVPPGDATAAAAAIVRLLGAPEYSRSLGQAARRSVERHYTQDAMLDRFIELYARLS